MVERSISYRGRTRKKIQKHEEVWRVQGATRTPWREIYKWMFVFLTASLFNGPVYYGPLVTMVFWSFLWHGLSTRNPFELSVIIADYATQPGTVDSYVPKLHKHYDWVNLDMEDSQYLGVFFLEFGGMCSLLFMIHLIFIFKWVPKISSSSILRVHG